MDSERDLDEPSHRLEGSREIFLILQIQVKISQYHPILISSVGSELQCDDAGV